MIEHRLIERMIPCLKKEKTRLEEKRCIDCSFLNQTVDFFRMYADKCHHGKEEDILFKALVDKEISPEHKKVIASLMEDHKYGRSLIKKLDSIKDNDANDISESVEAVLKILDELLCLYPRHIQTEDDELFIPAMDYFDEEEQQRMRDEFFDFDRTMIHTKYKQMIVSLEDER